MSTIPQFTKPNDFQKLLERSKTYDKPTQPSLKRLDVPEEIPNQKTLDINNVIKQGFEINNQPPPFNNSTEPPTGLRDETIQGIKQLAEDAKKEEKKEEEENDDYWYDDYGNKIRNLHQNRKRRKAIEARCSEMSIIDLLTNQWVEQHVPIVPDKFVITYRSLSGEIDLLIKSIIAKEVHYANQISSLYSIGKSSLLRLAACVRKINGRELPDIKGPNGKPDEELLKKKFDYISAYPIDILSDLDINYMWFAERVRELSVADNIINF